MPEEPLTMWTNTGYACHDKLEPSMRIRLLPAFLVLTLTASAQLPEKGLWRAASQNAANITGDVSFSKSKINIGFNGFPLTPARELKPAEVAALYDVAADTAGNGQLYRLSIPGTLRLLNRNTLCGTADIHWMATYMDGKVLKLTFFSSEEAPTLTFEAVQNSPDVCGTFTYVR